MLFPKENKQSPYLEKPSQNSKNQQFIQKTRFFIFRKQQTSVREGQKRENITQHYYL